jgi:hypothetical protein
MLVLNGTGTVTTLESALGRTSIGGTIGVTTLNMAGGDVEMKQGGSTTIPTTINMTGGSLYTERGATTLNIYGGTFRVVSRTGTTTFTTINFFGGSLILEQCGTITTLNLRSGDVSNIRLSKTVTITNTDIWATVANADSFRNNPLITFTNAPTWTFSQGRQF